MEDEIFFNQSKYIKDILKKFGLEDSKPTKTPMSTKIKLTKEEEAESMDSSKYRGTRIETVVYANSDHVGDYVDRKSTSGVCMFMGCCLTSWFTKKQMALAIFMTEAEYVSAGKACQQVALDHYRDALSVIYLIFINSSNFEILTVLDIAYHAILTVLDIVYHAILTVLDIVYHAILTVLDIVYHATLTVLNIVYHAILTVLDIIMPPRKAPRTRTTPATTTNTTSVTNAQLQAMIDQGVAAALATRDANRSTNGEDSHNSGTGVRRTERVARECTYQDFMKCQPLFFKGTEGVVKLTQWFERMETVFRISNCTVENQIKFSTCTLLGVALTWWNSHVRTVGHDVAYAMTWTDLKKKMTDKYCPRSEIKKLKVELWNLKVKGTDVLGYNQRFQELALLCVRMFSEESDKIEKYVGGLPDMIHGSVMASRPKTMQDAIEMATELMDKKISTLAERQAENKRKLDNNNQAQQQSPKRQNVAQAYAAGTGERKEYAGTLPLCNRCKLHHNGPCTVKCGNCKKIGHMTRDCRNHAAARNQRTLTYYECGNPGHYRSDCPELNNQNHGNKVVGTRARGLVHALGGGEADQDLNDMEDDIRVVRFRKRGKLNPRYVKPFKCYADEPLDVPLDGLHFDDKLQFVEEPVEIMDREVKRLKQSRITIVKVRWNSKRGPEFTWELKSRISHSQIDVVTNLDGVTVSGDQVPNDFVAHYETFLGQQGDTNHFSTVELFPNKLDSNKAAVMVCPLSTQEVKEAIFSMGNDKSLGPDGTKMPCEYQQDYKKTRIYAPKIYNDPNMPESLGDIYRTLESRYVHEGRTIDPSFYNDLSDDLVAKFTAIGFDCLLSLDEQICPRPCELVIRENVYSAIGNRDHTQAVIALMLYCLENSQPFNLAYFIIRRTYFFRYRRDKVLAYGMILTPLFKNLKANMAQGSFDERYKLVPRKMFSLKAKQPKRPPPKRTRNVGKSKRTQLSTSSSTESPPSDNEDLPSTKLSPRSYHRALKDDPNKYKEQRETR
ncbi:reverse transcriptase domain-containing protein [Tanacetum coccineum]